MKSTVLKGVLSLALSALLLTACSSGLTWTNNPYRGASNNTCEVRFSDPQAAFALLCRQFITKDFKVTQYSGDLMLAEFRYNFVGSETWSGASSTVAPYADPLAKGLLGNPYGKNAWAEIRLSVQPGNGVSQELLVSTTIKTWGEPDGVGGAGPYPLNSKGKLEAILLQEIENFKKQYTNPADQEVHQQIQKKGKF